MNFNYKIIVDSCCKLKEEYIKDSRFEVVNAKNEISSDKELANKYMEAYDTMASHIYVLTPSLYTSNKYMSAVIAADEYENKHDAVLNIHVIDSELGNEDNIKVVDEIIKLENAGMPFDEIVGKIEVLKNSIRNYFLPKMA